MIGTSVKGPESHDMSSTAADRPLDEPFQTYFDTPLADGVLSVACSGPQAAGTPVVLALHGMTGTHMVYRTLARELGARPVPSASWCPTCAAAGAARSFRRPTAWTRMWTT